VIRAALGPGTTAASCAPPRTLGIHKTALLRKMKKLDVTWGRGR
jgi:hypothetical protein